MAPTSEAGHENNDFTNEMLSDANGNDVFTNEMPSDANGNDLFTNETINRCYPCIGIADESNTPKP